jgi:hypothetical protein
LSANGPSFFTKAKATPPIKITTPRETATYNTVLIHPSGSVHAFGLQITVDGFVEFAVERTN